MIIKEAHQLERALAKAPTTRLFLFYGPDESGSRALVARVAAAVGADAERVDLPAADLKNDPARLLDEAAAFSMFGGPRYLLVERAGDEILPAVAGLLQAEVAGNPVVIVAGDLKRGSKLMKAATDAAGAVAFASYAPDGAKADQLVLDMAREHGLVVRSDVARRVAEASGGNCAVIGQELGKYALYLDSAPDRPRPLDHDTVDAIGAGGAAELARLVDSAGDGNAAALETELIRLRAEGVEGIPLIRAMLRRMVQLAKLRTEVDQGSSPSAVMASSGKSLFWKERDSIARQLGRWPSELISKAISRLVEAERQIKSSGGIGPIAADEELFAICRQAARRR